MGLLQKLFPFDELKATIARFPFSVACTFSLFVLLILDVHDFIEIDDKIGQRLLVVLGTGYFWFGIAKLVSESLSFKPLSYLLLAFGGMLGIVGLTFTGPIWWMGFFYLFPALLLILMFAGYLKGGDDLSVWFFNRKLWFGVLVSYVALLLFAGGLMVALMAIKTLFGLEISHKVYSDIWGFATLVLGPIYALSWVPKSFSFKEEDCTDPPGLKFIVNWISAPMVFVYLLILYAYFIKIGIMGEVPNGHLAYLISGFVAAGVVTYLAAFPLREEGSPQLRLFYKIFFPALIIPVAFHFYAIWERVSAYGITEQRYMLAVSAVWFAFLAIGNTFWRLPIKSIPMVLAALLLIASFGPWSASSVSAKSQFARLEALVEKNALVVNGKAVKRADAEEAVSFQDRQDISSILDYLCRTDRDAMIEDWFEVTDDKPFNCYPYERIKAFGFEYVGSYQREQSEGDEYVELRGSQQYNSIVDVDGYKLFLPSAHVYVRDDDKAWEHAWPGVSSVNASYESGKLTITVGPHGDVVFDVQKYAQEQIAINPVGNARDMVIEESQNGVRARLIISSIGMRKAGDGSGYKITSLGFRGLVDY